MQQLTNTISLNKHLDTLGLTWRSQPIWWWVEDCFKNIGLATWRAQSPKSVLSSPRPPYMGGGWSAYSIYVTAQMLGESLDTLIKQLLRHCPMRWFKHKQTKLELDAERDNRQYSSSCRNASMWSYFIPLQLSFSALLSCDWSPSKCLPVSVSATLCYCDPLERWRKWLWQPRKTRTLYSS